jgi:hypothetical protein
LSSSSLSSYYYDHKRTFEARVGLGEMTLVNDDDDDNDDNEDALNRITLSFALSVLKRDVDVNNMHMLVFVIAVPVADLFELICF